jgi:hypothetical protein
VRRERVRQALHVVERSRGLRVRLHFRHGLSVGQTVQPRRRALRDTLRSARYCGQFPPEQQTSPQRFSLDGPRG